MQRRILPFWGMFRTHAILGIFWALASFLFLFPITAGAAESSLPRGNYDELRQTGTGTVAQVLSPATVQMSTGEIVRLAGLYFPDYSEDNAGPYALSAMNILKDMLVGQPVVLYQTRKAGVGRMNRMGHSLAHLVRQSDGAWVQGALLRLGLAMVQIDVGNPEMAGQMLALEAAARDEKSGIWESLIHVLSPDETTEHIGQFVIVEGMVESVALKNNRLYFNFGKNWKDDFTVTVAPQNKRFFNGTGINPLNWSKETVRVRGVLSELNGPNMEIDHPGTLEIIKPRAEDGRIPLPAEQQNPAQPRDSVLPLPLPQRQEKQPHASQLLPSTR